MLENILFNTGSDNFITGLGIAISGLVIVFVVLVLICGILYLFSRLFYKKPQPAAEAAQESVEEAAAQPEAEEAGTEDEAELVAAMTAAIACCLGRSADGLVVRSFRRIGRKRGR